MTKRRMRSALRALSTALIICGTLLLADAGATLLWQEPVSALYARFQQGELQGQFDRLERVKPTPVEQRALKKLPDPRRRLAFSARALDRKTDDGDAVGKLLIDRIGLSTVFVEGTNAGDLRAGPGHFPDTPLPGQRGTVGDRRAPHDLRRAVPQDRQGPLRRRDRDRDAVRPLHLPRGAQADRRRRPPSGSPTACPTTG